MNWKIFLVGALCSFEIHAEPDLTGYLGISPGDFIDPIGRTGVPRNLDLGQPGVCNTLQSQPALTAIEYAEKAEALRKEFEEIFSEPSEKYSSIDVSNTELLAEARAYLQERESLLNEYVFRLNELRSLAGLEAVALPASPFAGIVNRGPGGSVCEALNTSTRNYVQVCNTCKVGMRTYFSTDCDLSLYLSTAESIEWACFQYHDRGTFVSRPVEARVRRTESSSRSWCGICPNCENGWGPVYLPAFETAFKEFVFESCQQRIRDWCDERIVVEHEVFYDYRRVNVTRLPSCSVNALTNSCECILPEYEGYDPPPKTFTSFCSNNPTPGNNFQCRSPIDYDPRR